MERSSEALQKIKSSMENIQSTQQLFTEQQKQIRKYKQACENCKSYHLGRKNLTIGSKTIDLVSHGESYCTLCHAKFCNEYPNEKICSDIYCKECIQKGNKLKAQGSLSDQEDALMKKSCLQCKKVTCKKDAVLDKEDETLCKMIDEMINYYIAYKKKI